MNREEKFLLEITKSYFNNSTPPDCSDINWENFFHLAKYHNLIGICHCVFNKNKALAVPEKIRKGFEDKFFDTVYIYECQKNALDDIKSCFNENGIKYITFKGAVLRELYPVPESRSMGDIDILVEKNERSRVKTVLKGIGFDFSSSSETVDTYVRDNTAVEIHIRLTNEFDCPAFDNAFEIAEFNGNEGRLEDTCHFAYLIAHTAGHLKFTGAGLRFVLDLAVMLRSKEINLDEVFKILESINLVTFAKVIISVCFQWFSQGQCFCDNTATVQEYLVQDGVFGSLKDSEHATVQRLRQIGAYDDNGTGNRSALALKLRLAFPPYSSLRNSTYIKFLNGRPWLLPAAWVYRFFHNIKNNPAHMMETVKNTGDEKTTALARQEYKFFEEIGLI